MTIKVGDRILDGFGLNWVGYVFTFSITLNKKEAMMFMVIFFPFHVFAGFFKQFVI